MVEENLDNSAPQFFEPIELPRDSAGRIRWARLKDNPEQLTLVIESEARVVLDEGGELNHNGLKSAGRFNLLNAIRRYYPRGLIVLEESLEITPGRKPWGYWQGPEAAENIRREAATFLETEGGLTQKLLTEKGRADLSNAVRLYPGGLTQLKADIGIEVTKKPIGYWTDDTIRQEAQRLAESEGRLAPNFLSGIGRDDLRTAITQQYPGGWAKLRSDLGLKQLRVPNDFWTLEQIRVRAQAFIETHGQIKASLLEKAGRSDLAGAISNHYEGGWLQLRIDLGLEPLVNHWTVESMEERAKKFYEQYGKITYLLLQRNGLSGLAAAIKKYPGGIPALREKVSGDFTANQVIPVNEANEQLERLLEVQND